MDNFFDWSVICQILAIHLNDLLASGLSVVEGPGDVSWPVQILTTAVHQKHARTEKKRNISDQKAEHARTWRGKWQKWKVTHARTLKGTYQLKEDMSELRKEHFRTECKKEHTNWKKNMVWRKEKHLDLHWDGLVIEMLPMKDIDYVTCRQFCLSPGLTSNEWLHR